MKGLLKHYTVNFLKNMDRKEQKVKQDQPGSCLTQEHNEYKVEVYLTGRQLYSSFFSDHI